MHQYITCKYIISATEKVAVASILSGWQSPGELVGGEVEEVCAVGEGISKSEVAKFFSGEFGDEWSSSLDFFDGGTDGRSEDRGGNWEAIFFNFMSSA